MDRVCIEKLLQNSNRAVKNFLNRTEYNLKWVLKDNVRQYINLNLVATYILRFSYQLENLNKHFDHCNICIVINHN